MVTPGLDWKHSSILPSRAVGPPAKRTDAGWQPWERKISIIYVAMNSRLKYCSARGHIHFQLQPNINISIEGGVGGGGGGGGGRLAINSMYSLVVTTCLGLLGSFRISGQHCSVE